MKISTILVTMSITMLLLALPASAANYTLGVFGNANEDETINMQDVTTPRFVVGAAYWAKCFHPELFSDLDPQAIHQEYLTDFLGLDYDLDEQGVFVYPEP